MPVLFSAWNHWTPGSNKWKHQSHWVLLVLCCQGNFLKMSSCALFSGLWSSACLALKWTYKPNHHHDRVQGQNLSISFSFFIPFISLPFDNYHLIISKRAESIDYAEKLPYVASLGCTLWQQGPAQSRLIHLRFPESPVIKEHRIGERSRAVC